MGQLVLQVRNVRTGEIMKQRLVSTLASNSLGVKAHVLQTSGVTLAGKWVVLQEPGNRIVIEKWDDGAVVARSLGRALAFDAAGARLIVQNRERELKMINPTGAGVGDAVSGADSDSGISERWAAVCGGDGGSESLYGWGAIRVICWRRTYEEFPQLCVTRAVLCGFLSGGCHL